MSTPKELPGFIRALPEADIPFPGARAWLLQGPGQQAAFVEFDQTVEVPEHAHGEQWEIVLEGGVTLRVGGRAVDHVAGDHFYLPAGVPHAATVRAGYKAIIVFNEPDRYTPKPAP